MALYDTLLTNIEKNDFTAGVVGLGYVGLPLVDAMCAKGINVIGFDIDRNKAARLNDGKSYLDTVSDDQVKSWRDQDLFEATDDMSRLGEADFILICVPTPLDERSEPDLSYVETTAQAVAKTLRTGQVVILESTTYPGTTKDVLKPILEAGGKKEGTDFYLVYAPEREDPGNKHFNTATITKIVGADNESALAVAVKFYERFLEKVLPVSNSGTAEAVKITENIFRAVNIALVNEMKVIYDRMGIDVWEVIEAAKTKPFGYMPFYPGPGLGGHCIPIDPFYLTWKAKQYGVPTRFIELAGEINTSMPGYVVEKLKTALGGNMDGTKVLLSGIAYKKNVNDQRETPAFPLIRLLEEGGAQVDFYDPYHPEILPARHYPELAGRKSIDWSEENIKSYDAVIIVTDHDDVDYNALADHAQLVIDTRNAMAGIQGANIVKA